MRPSVSESESAARIPAAALTSASSAEVSACRDPVDTAIGVHIVRAAPRLEPSTLAAHATSADPPRLLPPRRRCRRLRRRLGRAERDRRRRPPRPRRRPPPTSPKDISTDLTEKPAIATPSGDPPAELETADIVKGKGKAAKKGDIVDVQYVGNSWSTGKQFDASWDRGTQPFTFPLGAGQVIPGWDQGVAGMKEGGRRLLVIPSELAYGDQSPSPDIGPGETLVFVVDLKGIH